MAHLSFFEMLDGDQVLWIPKCNALYYQPHREALEDGEVLVAELELK